MVSRGGSSSPTSLRQRPWFYSPTTVRRYIIYSDELIGAIDGTHVRVKVPRSDAARFRGRKDWPTQNVFAVCNFDMKFTYVLGGWEGTASDSRILKDVLSRQDPLIISQAEVDRELMEEDVNTMSTQVREEDYREGWKMNRGKAIAHDSSVAVREFTKWTDDMDLRLLTAMLDEARQKSLKDRWREVHDLFSGLSGFAWDESTKRFSAELEVWDELITTKPSAAKWRVNPIRYYDLMEELWGVDRATEHMARTARQARRNISTPSFSVDLNDDVDNIPEEQPFDPGFDSAYRSPPHVDSYSPGDGTQSIPSAASTGTGGTSSSRGTKRKAPMVDVMDAQFDKLTTKLDAFTDYFGRGNELTQRLSDIVEKRVVAIERRNDLINEQINVMRRTSAVQYSELDIWEMLVCMNLPDEQIMVQCYDWLCNNPSHVRRLFGLPPHLRLNQLLKLTGASGMASGSRPTRKRTSMDRKGKCTTTSDEAPRSRLSPIEVVLNQTRFFSKCEQMITTIFSPPFRISRFKHFVAMSSSYFEDLIKVFYSNLRVSKAGYLYSEVNKTKIKMKPADWLIVAGLKYEGHKLSFTNIPEDIEYDRDTALASMIRPEMEGQNYGRVNQDHGQNPEDEDQPMSEEHIADIGP
ncbi:hypothetical protein Fmac_013102 [Flemingia macrophylla]|uniref:DDE Tnp4 domain-containing protein n=1 Tax=Flemingia macrophylla TaxID=520843 RepID=A0ABD1MSN2_9FABA